jgi:nucleoside-diphosphate-sugar epimerase
MGKLIVGCGYLGLRIAELWRNQGEQVFATTRKPARAEELARLGLQPVVCDVLDPTTLERLPAADSVIYCVANDRSANVSMRRLYVDGVRHVLDVIPSSTRFVYISSTSVYGQTGGEKVTEESTTSPIEESGQVVLEAEQTVRRRRPDAIILRFAGIYGPGRLLRAAALLAGEPLAADPDGWLNLIHVEDGARIAVAAEARGEPGTIYNVSDGRRVRRREFFTCLAKSIGAPEPRFAPPTRSARENNRRISNARMTSRLGVELLHPSSLEMNGYQG